MDYSLIVKLTNNCNLNCSYCYHRRDHNRDFNSTMPRETLDAMIKGLLLHNKEHAEFIWHGGEPLLVGLDTFRFIVEKEKEYNVHGLLIRNSIQTNGILLDADYIRFFQENGFHVGVSVDGPFEMHTLQRGTDISEYERILSSVQKLNDSQAKHGILCVVGKQHIHQAAQLFDMFVRNGIQHIGFLPCLVQENGVVDYSFTVTPEEYASFLINFFEVWVHSDAKGLCVRNFDDGIRFYRNRPAMTCINTNSCTRYLTVLPNGNIYLCDNFSLNEEHCVGHVDTGFDEVETAQAMCWLEQALIETPAACTKCKFYKGCYGGCKYYRWVSDPGMKKAQFYCLSTRRLYEHIGNYFNKKEQE